jgi:hypothetical protein
LHTCPFCSAEIEETVALFGGTCAACFAWVPGEETPTDPGVDTGILRRKKRQQSRTHRWVLMLILLGLALTCGTLLLVLQQFDFSIPKVVKEFEEHVDKGLVGMPVDEKVKLEAEEQVVEDEKSVVEPRRMPGERASGSSQTVEPSALVDGVSLGMPEVTQRRRADALDDADSIRSMVSARMSAQLPGLERCYLQRLEADSTLRGRWRVEFVVQQDGRVGSAGVFGRGVEDEVMEACMVQEMSTWTFDRITQEFTSSKTLVFEPAH